MSKFIYTLNGLILLELDLVEDPPDVEANHMRISLNWVKILVFFHPSDFSMSCSISLVACLLSVSSAIFDLVVRVDRYSKVKGSVYLDF